MTSFNFGDVITVPFPFIDRPISKLRPALVLSDSPDGDHGQHLVLAMITSAKRSHWKSDLVLSDWQKAGLKAESLVRWKIFTIEAALVQQKRGCLSNNDLKAAKTSFAHIFSI